MYIRLCVCVLNIFIYIHKHRQHIMRPQLHQRIYIRQYPENLIFQNVTICLRPTQLSIKDHPALFFFNVTESITVFFLLFSSLFSFSLFLFHTRFLYFFSYLSVSLPLPLPHFISLPQPLSSLHFSRSTFLLPSYLTLVSFHLYQLISPSPYQFSRYQNQGHIIYYNYRRLSSVFSSHALKITSFLFIKIHFLSLYLHTLFPSTFLSSLLMLIFSSPKSFSSSPTLLLNNIFFFNLFFPQTPFFVTALLLLCSLSPFF